MKRFYLLNKAEKQLAATIYEPNDSGVLTLIIGDKQSTQENELIKYITEYLAANNHNVLTFDYRNQGLSEKDENSTTNEDVFTINGKNPNPTNTLTHDEQLEDLHTVIEYAQKHFRNIGIIGINQGGYISTVYAANNESIHHLINIAATPESPEDLYDLEAAIPTITCPTLFCHGTADEVLPASESESLFRLKKEPKELFLIMDADHHFIMKRHKENLMMQLEEWLSSLH